MRPISSTELAGKEIAALHALEYPEAIAQVLIATRCIELFGIISVLCAGEGESVTRVDDQKGAEAFLNSKRAVGILVDLDHDIEAGFNLIEWFAAAKPHSNFLVAISADSRLEAGSLCAGADFFCPNQIANLISLKVFISSRMKRISEFQSGIHSATQKIGSGEHAEPEHKIVDFVSRRIDRNLADGDLVPWFGDRHVEDAKCSELPCHAPSRRGGAILLPEQRRGMVLGRPVRIPVASRPVSLTANE